MKGLLCPLFCARAGVVAASFLVSALSVLLLAGRGPRLLPPSPR